MSNDYRVKMEQISKHFDGVYALKQASFEILPGEIHALMGENGAGKSTLMKILSGAIKKDEGKIYIDGKEANIGCPHDAMEAGISIVYQEFVLAPDLTVAENILFAQCMRKPVINWKKINQDARVLLDSLGFDIDSGAKVCELSVACQQVVEICKALSRNCRILILDEPTAVLAQNEVTQLFRLLKELRQRGVSIIYISHRLDEIMEIADQVTVLRDGENVQTVNTADVSKENIISMMIGRSLDAIYPKRKSNIGKVLLEAQNISRGRVVRDVSLHVRAGEVVGIGGLVGAGRTETARAIFGADKKESGQVLIEGKQCRIRSPKDAVRHGIGLLPESRKDQALVIDMPIRHNVTMSCLKTMTNPLGVILKEKETTLVDQVIQSLRIKTESGEKIVSSLSGGNQQKVAIAKWLASKCRIVLFDEPTRGVDVGAKYEIYKLINQLAEEGVAVLMISSYMPELIGMCDRIEVMHEGRLKGELMPEDFSEENILKLALE